MHAKLRNSKPSVCQTVCTSATSLTATITNATASLTTKIIMQAILHTNVVMFCLVWLLFAPMLSVNAGSCREAQLCCSGRDSSCVVQKAPMNAIIEDLNDKPCYCDHACLKLGDCCKDFKDHCAVLDCEVGDWNPWSECDNSCGKGTMSRTRQVLQAAQNGGKHCPMLLQKRACHGYHCHGNHDKNILRETALLLPSAISHVKHVNNSMDIRHNIHVTHAESHRHKQDYEYCVEFEVFKTAKSCKNLPPYNLLQEGDRIIVHCSLANVMQDATKPTVKSVLTKRHRRKLQINSNSYQDSDIQNDNIQVNNEHNALADGSMEYDEEAQNEQDEQLDSDESEQNVDYDAVAMYVAQSASTTTTTTRPRSMHSLHCIGEGLSGHITRWSALPAPSCRGKWLRLSIDAPKKCTNSQFIFV